MPTQSLLCSLNCEVTLSTSSETWRQACWLLSCPCPPWAWNHLCISWVHNRSRFKLPHLVCCPCTHIALFCWHWYCLPTSGQETLLLCFVFRIPNEKLQAKLIVWHILIAIWYTEIRLHHLQNYIFKFFTSLPSSCPRQTSWEDPYL